MASKRRLLVLLGAALLTLVLCGSVLFSQAPSGGGNVGAPSGPSAGPPGAPTGPPGAPPGAAPTAAAPAAGPTAGGQEMPESLLKTYDEAVAEYPSIAEAGIPEEYRTKRFTIIEWRQLARIFLGRVEAALPAEGKIGRAVRPGLQIDISQRQIEMQIMADLHEQALAEGFWFEVSMPKITADVAGPQATPETCTVRVGAIMHPRPKFANRLLERLKNYSGRGEGREPFYFITDRGGMFKYHRLFLSQEAINHWSQLWGSNVVELTVYDAKDKRLVAPIQQPAGHSGSTICDMVRPPTLYYAASDWRHGGGGGAAAGGMSSAGSGMMGPGDEEGGYGGPGGPMMGPSGAGGAGGEAVFFPFASRPVENRHADGGAVTIPTPSWVGEKVVPLSRYSHLPERESWKRQDGKVLKVDGVKGWYYHFEFQLPIGRVGDIDHCTAELFSLPLGAAPAPGAGPMGGLGGPASYGYGDEEDY